MNSYEGHTPGPWNFEDTLVFTREPMETVDGGTSIEFVEIADCSSYEIHGGYDARANARLIAAAPDLLAALTALVNQTDAPEYFPTEVENARAAIARATGGRQ